MTKYKTISENILTIKSNRIVKHDVKPSRLEADLMKSEDSSFEILFGIEGNKYGSCRACITKLGKIPEEKAKEKYERLLNKLKKGEYELHLYTDGTFKVRVSS